MHQVVKQNKELKQKGCRLHPFLQTKVQYLIMRLIDTNKAKIL